jgi:hypothetical protein
VGDEQQPDSTAGSAGGSDRDQASSSEAPASSSEVPAPKASSSEEERPASSEGESPDKDAAPDGEADQEGGVFDELPPEIEYPLRPGEKVEGLPSRMEGWRRRSAAGAIFTGLALGMREVLEPDRNEPGIVMETSGVPPKDLPVEADIEQVPPRQSVVKIRPWLLGDNGETSDDASPSRPSDLGTTSTGRDRTEDEDEVRPRRIPTPLAPRKR